MAMDRGFLRPWRVGVGRRGLARDIRKGRPHGGRLSRHRHTPYDYMVGMLKSAPDRMPVGQRAVMVFNLV